MMRSQAHGRLDGVRDELRAATFCIARTLADVQADPNLLRGSPHQLRPSNVATCGSNVEVTYLIRLFAEFEDVCRDYWAAARPAAGGRRPRTQMEALVNRVADLRDMPADVRANAHAVRSYRNEVVHARDRAGRHSFAECRSWLARYVSHLPVQW